MASGFGFVRKRHTFLIPRNSCNFPDRCAQCQAPNPGSSLQLMSQLGYFKRRVFLGTVWEYLRLEVPFCRSCSARQMRWRRVGQCWSATVLVGAPATVIWLDIGRWGQWIIASAAVILAFAPFLLMHVRLGVHVVGYSNKNLHLSFKHPEYAREFATLNGLLEIVRPGGEVMYVPKQDKADATPSAPRKRM